MRLIDADYLMCDIGCVDAVKYGNETPEQQHKSYSTLMMYEIADYINDAETVDAVAVVRCGDCKYSCNPSKCPIEFAALHVPEDFYCAYGAKMDAEVSE